MGGRENAYVHATMRPPMYAAGYVVVPCLLHDTSMPLGFMHPALTLCVSAMLNSINSEAIST